MNPRGKIRDEMDRAGKIAFVTGGTGAIGPALVRTLIQRGYTVRALCRQQPEDHLLRREATIVRGDVGNLASLEAGMEGADVAFHFASRLHTNEPADAERNEYWRVNVEGTRCVVEASRRQKVRRLVFASSVSVYGASGARAVLDEKSRPRPESLYAETKLAAENIVLGEIHSVVLRFGAVYGPRMKGNYARLARAIKHRRFVPVGKGTNLRTLIFLNDAVDAALLAAQHSSAEGQTYNVTDGETHRVREIVRAVYEALGRTPPTIYIPLPALKVGVRVAQSLANAVGIKPPITTSSLAKLEEDVAVRGDKIQAQLAFTPKYKLREGWVETMRLGDF